jgi:hypothetical protein
LPIASHRAFRGSEDLDFRKIPPIARRIPREQGNVADGGVPADVVPARKPASQGRGFALIQGGGQGGIQSFDCGVADGYLEVNDQIDDECRVLSGLCEHPP